MIKIIVMKKRHDRCGNPIFTLFIDKIENKVKGLRKLKQPHMFSISSYNLRYTLENYVFKDKKVCIEEEE